ncbi:hypothetical protein DIL11_21505 [Salmonella enterica]|nr:hypothetical protein [Salmonella enterica]
MDKTALLLERLRQRTESSLASGGDGFIFASMLAFDVGLNTRTVRGMLDSFVQSGMLEKKARGVGRAHKYRKIKQND